MLSIVGTCKHRPYKPRITEDIIVSLFKDPVHAWFLELSQGPRGYIRLVRQYVVLIYGGDVDILVLDTLSGQLEKPQVVWCIIGIVGWRRWKGIPQFCFFFLHGRLVELILVFIYLFI